jgi:hypothetical protein
MRGTGDSLFMDALSASSTGSTEMRDRPWRRTRQILLGAGIALLLLVSLPLTAYFRENASKVSPKLVYESWSAVADGRHNSNTDLIHWNGLYYLVHASAPYHFASDDCRLKLWTSPDCRTWKMLREFYVPGEDIRDPKFAPIAGRLFLYTLKNKEFSAEPYSTQFTYTEEGVNWQPLRDIGPEGWIFWRPKTRDGRVWYMPAYWHEHGKSILLTSRNGQQWTEVSVIHEGNRNDETDIEFLPDGRLLATARLEESDSYFGDAEARTLLAVAEPPYTQWSKTSSYLTRLDGPCLFNYEGQVYAVGRYHPDKPSVVNRVGGILGRKRTSLFRVQPDGMEWLSDLPSGGDTSYAGVARQGDDLYVSYYTSPIEYDWPWVFGMLLESDIRIAKIHLPSLKSLP